MEENTYSQVIEDNIRAHFERHGILDEMRSGLHVNVLKMMRGEMDLKRDEPLCGGDFKQRGLLQLMNYLVVDYFNWYGYKHTLETFALETGDKCQLKPREKLQLEFGDSFKQKELPILLQMVMKQTKKVDDKTFQKDNLKDVNTTKPHGASPRKSPNAGLVVKDIPPEGNLSKSLKFPAQKFKDTNKALKPREPSPFKKDIKKPQIKLNVRKTLADSTQVRNAAAASSKLKEQVFEVESSSKSTTGPSSEDDEDGMSGDSDAFADIPNRYYYREEEPPERTYPQGCGEEGPYEGSTVPTKLRTNQPNLQRIVKRKPLRIFEVQCDEEKEKPHCSNRNTARPIMPVKETRARTFEPNLHKRAKCLFQSQKHVNPSDNEHDLPVSKPKCPPTMVSNIQGSSGNSDEDSDFYL